MKLSQSELNHYTNLWCKVKGFKSKDLELHPHIDDMILLITIREEYSDFFTQEQWDEWKKLWVMVYSKKFSLKKFHRKTLEQITIKAIIRQSKQQLQRLKIKQLRQEI